MYEEWRIIREKIVEDKKGKKKEYGLFMEEEEVKKGVWIEKIRKIE